MNQVYIIGGMRTPIGKMGGFLKGLLPEELASLVLQDVVRKYNVSPQDIDQVVFGNAVGPGGNIARVSVLKAGWPYSTPALTVDSQCGSGLSAIQVASQQILAGQGDLVIAGGVESTSMAPRRQFNAADPRFQGEDVYYERAPFSTPEIGDPDIGEGAENLAALLNISRESMDSLALESHRRASFTKEQGLFTDIMTPVTSSGKIITTDECIRSQMSLKLLARMKPVFKDGGNITAGNTCLKHDGAAVILLASKQAVEKYNLQPQALLGRTVSCGFDPNLFPLSPVPAIQKLVAAHGLALSDIDALEMNEAFAVKILACCKQLNFSLDKTNQLGGALAYGHPYGASGAIILLHLLKTLQQIQGRYGIASIGAVGGMGTATLIEGVKTMLIHQMFDNLTEDQAKKICLVYGDTNFTYQDFAQAIDDLAYRFGTQIKKGDRVLLKLLSPISQLLYFFAILKAGGICIFIDSSTSQEVCAELINNHSIHLVVDEDFQLTSIKTLELPRVMQEDIFLGALSSGSTGTPKLIWRDHQSWKNGFTVQSEVFNLSSSDTLYLVSSLVYTANLNACLHLLAEGGRVVIGGSSLPRTWLEEMITHKVSALFMVPANYRVLLKVMKNPLSAITSIVTAGAKIDSETVQRLMQYFPKAGVYEYYGASELGHVSYSTAEDLLKHPDSVGKAFPGVTITIEDDSIWVESPYLTPKSRPKGTVEDLGRMDEDGYLYLLGRKQGIINTGGVKVIPEQVENILLQCPGIKEAAVVGIDDAIRGQKVCAWIVKENETLLSGDIIEFCRRKIRQHYCPSKIIFLDEIPVNKNGKVDKIRLKNSLQGSSVESKVL